MRLGFLFLVGDRKDTSPELEKLVRANTIGHSGTDLATGLLTSLDMNQYNPSQFSLTFYCQCLWAKKGQIFRVHWLVSILQSWACPHACFCSSAQVHSRARLIFTRMWRNLGVQTNCVQINLEVLNLAQEDALQTWVVSFPKLSVPLRTQPNSQLLLIYLHSTPRPSLRAPIHQPGVMCSNQGPGCLSTTSGQKCSPGKDLARQ